MSFDCDCVCAALPGEVQPWKVVLETHNSSWSGPTCIVADKDCGKCNGTGFKRADVRHRERMHDYGPALYRELRHLVGLLDPIERDGSMNVPGLATLNGAREVLREIDEGGDD